MRFTRDGERFVGFVARQNKDGTVTLDTGVVFDFDKGDRLEWIGSAAPKDLAPEISGNMRVVSVKGMTGFQRVLLWYSLLASSAALGWAALPLLK